MVFPAPEWVKRKNRAKSKTSKIHRGLTQHLVGQDPSTYKPRRYPIVIVDCRNAAMKRSRG